MLRFASCRSRSGVVAVVVCLAWVSSDACVTRSQRLEVQAVPREPVVVKTPVKAHLADGSTIVYRNGVTVTESALQGQGQVYDLKAVDRGSVDSVPLDQVVAMETFRTEGNTAETAGLTLLGTAAGTLGAMFLAAAIFGSCPTVYSDLGGREVLEAETFAYSIAPLFEARDVARLSARPDADGILTLEVRNEALETHHLNHLQLLEVSHAADEMVVPDSSGTPVVLRDVRPPASAVDRAGRNLTKVLRSSDGKAFATDPDTLRHASASDLDDWIDLVPPEAADPSALVFRLRNSLLNTVLLYDVMLRPAGARALPWLGSDLDQVPSAVALGGWYRGRMGLRVEIWRDGAYREVARLADSGPIAWKDFAVALPARRPGADPRVRLRFVADNWRIDSVGFASELRSAETRAVALTAVSSSKGGPEPAAAANLAEADRRYLETRPGQRFFARFEAGRQTQRPRTFLLVAQGYYTEWVRGSWIRSGGTGQPFVPSDAGLVEALRRWSESGGPFERAFQRNRVAVR